MIKDAEYNQICYTACTGYKAAKIWWVSASFGSFEIQT